MQIINHAFIPKEFPIHWAHVFFALYYTPVIHTLGYGKIGELRATHPLHVHRSAVYRHICLLYIMRGSRRGPGPPTWKIRISYIYIVKIHSNITENMPRNLTLHPPFQANLNIYSIPPWKKKILDPRMIYPPPSSTKKPSFIFPDNVVPLTKESYIHI